MRDVQSSECEPHGSIVLVDISSSRFLVIQREETKKCVFSFYNAFTVHLQYFTVSTL